MEFCSVINDECPMKERGLCRAGVCREFFNQINSPEDDKQYAPVTQSEQSN